MAPGKSGNVTAWGSSRHRLTVRSHWTQAPDRCRWGHQSTCLWCNMEAATDTMSALSGAGLRGVVDGLASSPRLVLRTRAACPIPAVATFCSRPAGLPTGLNTLTPPSRPSCIAYSRVPRTGHRCIRPFLTCLNRGTTQLVHPTGGKF